jgi:hypothetical protein
MDVELGNKSTLDALIYATEAGADAHCPFCKGRMVAPLSVGDRLVILGGVDAGKEAVVTATRGFNESEFYVRFDSDPKYEYRINYTRDTFAPAPIQIVPKWLCPLSIDDLNAIDKSIVQIFMRLAIKSSAEWTVDLLLPIVAVVRGRRLPIAAADLWPAFRAHGFSPKLEYSFEKYFDFALELLTTMHGRPAIKRKRVKAMSIGRYLTSTQLDFYGPSPGIDIENSDPS